MKAISTLLIAILLLASFAQLGEAASTSQEPLLTLSQVKCAGEKVEIQFVLENISIGDVISELVYKYGKIPPSNDIGKATVVYFTDTLDSGYYDIAYAFVVVNNEKIYLSNPGALKGDYRCGKELIPSPGLPIKRPTSAKITYSLISTSIEYAYKSVNR